MSKLSRRFARADAGSAEIGTRPATRDTDHPIDGSLDLSGGSHLQEDHAQSQVHHGDVEVADSAHEAVAETRAAGDAEHFGALGGSSFVDSSGSIQTFDEVHDHVGTSFENSGGSVEHHGASGLVGTSFETSAGSIAHFDAEGHSLGTSFEGASGSIEHYDAYGYHVGSSTGDTDIAEATGFFALAETSQEHEHAEQADGPEADSEADGPEDSADDSHADAGDGDGGDDGGDDD